MFQARIHISVIRAPLYIPHSWQIKRWRSLLKKTCNLCSMFILNNSKVWLIETVLFEMPYGRSTAQMVCVDVVWGTTVVTYGTNHNMDTCSLQILALSCFVNYNSESIQTHWLSCFFKHYNAVCYIYVHEAPWCEGQGTSQPGVQTASDQLSSHD